MSNNPYIGKIKNRGAQKVEVIKTEAKQGKVVRAAKNGDLRCGKKGA